MQYYAPEIFQLIGVKGSSNSLLTTGVYGVVKVVFTIVYVGWMVDRIGRRKPLLVGAVLQATAMLYLALYLRFAGTNTDAVGGTPAGGIVGIVWIYIYAFGWSFGHSVACYVVAAEIFPTRIVSLVAPAISSDLCGANRISSALSACRSASSSTGLSTTASLAQRLI
jgi:MFS family permease